MTLQSSAASGLTSATLPIIDLKGVVEALQSGIAPGIAPPEKPKPAKVSAARSSSSISPKRADAQPRRSGAGTPASSGAGTSAKSAVTPKDDISAERVYRRMPDAKELAAVYDRIGTVTGVAKHYDVPRHTAQGWMARLRKLDASPKASGRKNQRS
jgi:hypothetical protein